MRQFHYRFMELEPVEEEEEPQSLPLVQPQQTSQQLQVAAGPRACLWQDFGDQMEGDASCERLQRLEDEVAELRELNELLEFRLLEMENAETPGAPSHCCCGAACTRSSADAILDKSAPPAVVGAVAGRDSHAGRIVATVLPFTEFPSGERSPPPLSAVRPKLSDSSHESGIFDSDSDASDSDAHRDVDDDEVDNDDDPDEHRHHPFDEDDVDDGCDAGLPETPPRAPARRRRARACEGACRLTQVTQTDLTVELLSQAVQTETARRTQSSQTDAEPGCENCASQTDSKPVGCGALSGEIQKLELIREHMEQRARLEQRCQQLEWRRQEEQQLLRLWLPAALAWVLWRASLGQRPTICRALEQPLQQEPNQAACCIDTTDSRDWPTTERTEESCRCCERLQADHEEVMRRADEVWSELEQEHDQQLRQRDQLLRQHEQQLREAEQRLCEVERQLRLAEDDREALRMERSRLRRQVSQLLEAVSAADLSLQQLQAEVDDVLRPELAREKHACQQLQESMHEALAAAELRFQNEVNESNSKLQQVTNNLNEINCECEQLREEVETLEATVKELRAEIQSQKQHEEETKWALNRHIQNLELMINNKNNTSTCETKLCEIEKRQSSNITSVQITNTTQEKEMFEEHTSRFINGTFPNLDGPIDELSKVVRSLDDTLDYIKEIKEPKEDKPLPTPPSKMKPEVPPKKFLLGNHLLSNAKRNIMFWNDISCSKTSKNMQSWSFTSSTLGLPQEKQLLEQK